MTSGGMNALQVSFYCRRLARGCDPGGEMGGRDRKFAAGSGGPCALDRLVAPPGGALIRFFVPPPAPLCTRSVHRRRSSSHVASPSPVRAPFNWNAALSSAGQNPCKPQVGALRRRQRAAPRQLTPAHSLDPPPPCVQVSPAPPSGSGAFQVRLLPPPDTCTSHACPVAGGAAAAVPWGGRAHQVTRGDHLGRHPPPSPPNPTPPAGPSAASTAPSWPRQPR
jgi:hypothetical protein